MRRIATLALAMAFAGTAQAQPAELACGVLKAESSRQASTARWTISGPREGPRRRAC